MEIYDYKKFVAERKAKAESQARDYFYNKKERKPYYWGEVLVHHLLTVDGVTPNCPASQREVRFFSNKTILIRLISSILIVLFHKDSDLFSIYKQNREINMKLGYILGIFMYLLSKNGQMSVVLNTISFSIHLV